MTKAITTADETATADSWTSSVAEAICMAWGEQAFQIGVAGSFGTRIRAVATLIEDVAPRLASPGQLTDDEYAALLQAPIYRALSFLFPPTRKQLAHHLVADHARELEASRRATSEPALE